MRGAGPHAPPEGDDRREGGTARHDEPATSPGPDAPGPGAPGADAPGPGVSGPGPGTGTPLGDEPSAHEPGGAARLRARARTGWAATPLRTRLAALTAVLLGLGLLVAGLTNVTLLRGTLLGQVDAKLGDEGRRLAEQSVDTLFGLGQPEVFPTDYYVLVRIGQQEGGVANRYTVEEYGTPRVPDLTVAEARLRGGEPYTAPSDHAGSRWRMATYVFPGGEGTVTVALPQRDVDQAVARTAHLLLVSGVVIVALGALIGTWAVRRSLRPLREIESTAAAIAAGDLSRRVPTAPPSTEVGRLGDALNGMLAQVEEAFDARTQSEARMRRFVADASHELRTPLAAVRGYAELYRMGALGTPEQVADTMRRIEGSSTRMGSLVEDLLALARLDEGRPGQLGPVDLTVLAADAVSDLRALDPQRPVRLMTSGATTGPCVVTGDEARLRQVLANLVGNAARHTPPGTPVEIAVGPGTAPGTAVVEVRDHGPGIPPEHAARVFERFYRIDPSRTRDSGGSGLGMAIVAAIVESHGGTAQVLPTPGGGATIRVELPTAGPASRPSQAHGPRPADGPLGGPSGPTGEDDPRDRR